MSFGDFSLDLFILISIVAIIFFYGIAVAYSWIPLLYCTIIFAVVIAVVISIMVINTVVDGVDSFRNKTHDK